MESKDVVKIFDIHPGVSILVYIHPRVRILVHIHLGVRTIMTPLLNLSWP